MNWIVSFPTACIAFIAAMVAVIWAAGGFHTAGLSTTGLIAILGGVAATVLLAVALMALVFYSDRSGRDGP